MKNLYRGEVFYLIASPLDHVEAYRYFEDGGLAVVDGKIVEAGPFEEIRSHYPDFPVTDYSGKLITPGFIDSHIHFSQSEIQGMYGKQLLDWLDEYTFPAEEAFSSMEYAQDIARFFVKELVKNGTTTCAAYATVHPASVTALFSVASDYNMCILAGKVMMNRNAPDYLMDTTRQSELDCRRLIEDWDVIQENEYNEGEWINGGDIWSFSKMEIEVVDNETLELICTAENYEEAEKIAEDYAEEAGTHLMF